MFVRVAATVLALTALAAPAIAGAPVVAKLKAPVPAVTKPMVTGVIFVCTGDTCATPSSNDDTVTVRGCQQLVAKSGAVVSYGSSIKSLDAEKLAACNEKAK